MFAMQGIGLSQFKPIRPLPRTGLNAMKDVVFAIFLRELKTRFGGYRLGYFWAVLEPLAFVLILGWLRTFISADTVYGVPIFVFFALGYLTFQLFSKSLMQASSAIAANKGLFSYRQVKPIDAVLARIILELIVFLATMVILLSLFAWVGMPIKMENPLLVLAVLSNLVVFALGAGLIVMSISKFSKEVDKIIPLITRPLFFISGVFYSLQDIPQQFHHYLLVNPLLHAVELTRAGFYSIYPVDGVSLMYLSSWALVFLFLGISSHRLTRSKLVSS